MKLSIDRADLLRSLSHVQSVVERRNTIPILSNVLLKAQDGALSLSTTDMDLEILETVAAKAGTPGAITAPAHTLYDIVRKLPDGAAIEIDAPANDAGGVTSLTVKSGRSTFRLGCLPTEDFPAIGAGDLSVTFTLPAADLRTLIDRTRFAISTEETRYYLNGIYLHAAETDGVKVLRAVATDGHRLARFEMPLPDGAAKMPGIIIPRKAIAEIRKLIDEAGDGIEISLSETKLRFTFDHVTMTTKLIDGTFPDYERVIPDGNDKVLEIDPRAFAEAVDRVSTVSTEKTRAVKLALSKNTLTLSAHSPESGSATEEVEITYNGGDLEIGFNSSYLLDVLRQIEGEGCRLLLSDSAAPTIIQDTGDEAALYVLMPMRV